jgi:hypothetical protein
LHALTPCLLGERDTLLDCFARSSLGGRCVEADFAKAHRGDLIARGEQAVRAGFEVAAMDGKHFLRLRD